MHTFRFKSATPVLPPQAIHAIRSYAPLAVSEIRRRAAEGLPLLEFAIFDNAWQDSKPVMRRLVAAIDEGVIPLTVYEHFESSEFPPKDEPLTAAQFAERLASLREIELEQDTATQLEEGYIQSPEEYERPADGEA
jgi:hypothetical protein